MTTKKKSRTRTPDEIQEDYLAFLNHVKKTILGMLNKRAVLKHVDQKSRRVDHYTLRAMCDLSIIYVDTKPGEKFTFYKWKDESHEPDMHLAQMVYECARGHVRRVAEEKARKDALELAAKTGANPNDLLTNGNLTQKAKELKKKEVPQEKVKLKGTVFFREQLRMLDRMWIHSEVHINGMIVKGCTILSFVKEGKRLMLKVGDNNDLCSVELEIKGDVNIDKLENGVFVITTLNDGKA